MGKKRKITKNEKKRYKKVEKATKMKKSKKKRFAQKKILLKQSQYGTVI